MVQTYIKGKMYREKPPAAPLEDRAEIQYSVDPIPGFMFDSPLVDMPEQILLGYLRDGRFRVVSPLQVKLTYEDKHTIAEAVELDEFGFGENISEALADLQRAIAELYFTLEKEQSRLGTDLQRIWVVLQEKILKR
jgi:hypothetical protein